MNSNSFETNIARPSSLPKHCVFIFSSIKWKIQNGAKTCNHCHNNESSIKMWYSKKLAWTSTSCISSTQSQTVYEPFLTQDFVICMWVIKCWYPVWPNSMLQTKRHNGISNLKLICAVKNIGALSQRQVILVPAIKFPKCKQRRRAANPCYNRNSHVRVSLTPHFLPYNYNVKLTFIISPKSLAVFKILKTFNNNVL